MQPAVGLLRRLLVTFVPMPAARATLCHTHGLIWLLALAQAGVKSPDYD